MIFTVFYSLIFWLADEYLLLGAQNGADFEENGVGNRRGRKWNNRKNTIPYRQGAKIAKTAKKIKNLPLFLHEQATHRSGEPKSDAKQLLPLRSLHLCAFAGRFSG